MTSRTVDVIATPVADENCWWLTDRSGRSLGAVRKASGSAEVMILPNRDGALDGIEERHASLDDAFKAIAEHVRGTCELNPEMRE